MLFSEYILSKEFDMGYLSLEDIYPDDVEKYGHLRVGMTDLYVKIITPFMVWLRVLNTAS